LTCIKYGVAKITIYVIYASMLLVFDCWRNPPPLQTGWFVELPFVARMLVTYSILPHLVKGWLVRC